MQYIQLKPFKYDKNDVTRQYDLLRGFILFKEYIRRTKNGKCTTTSIALTMHRARLDIPQYQKLRKQFPTISVDSLNVIADYFSIKINIWFKASSRADAEKCFETTTQYEHDINFLGKYFNDGNDYDLSNLTLIIDVESLQNRIYNSLQNKLTQAYSFAEALSYGLTYLS